ncbi:MAG: T6SS effector amidase Tae4 family protein [Betaproteobacteria bacterium]|nr:T6SS effector amidase Tae4 family protein [Betaproteobacteria bacterium]
MAEFIDIKVPDVIEPGNALVTEVFVSRGKWVQSGDDVMTLESGEKKIYVVSPRTGVIMKVLAARGDSVPQKATLAHLKGVDNQRPNFHNAWRVFSQVAKFSVANIGKIFGSKVKQNIEIPKKEDGKWTNACAIRMSYMLNRTGFPIQRGKYEAVSARDGRWYMYRIDDMMLHLQDVFGTPDIVVNGSPVSDDFKDMKGILVITGDGRGDARGHVTLWDGLMCPDICHFANDKNETFSPRKAALWVLP